MSDQARSRGAKYSRRAFGALKNVWGSELEVTPISPPPALPRTSQARQQQSADPSPINVEEVLSASSDELSSKDTVLYLAYGSNLSAETFKGTRGIKPLSAVNVSVPSLALTFDLPGLPYKEPCFANTRRRDPEEAHNREGYHKDRWHKGLVGVVYEVTRSDYATIIATEGGGASYKDITVTCYEIPCGAKEVATTNTTPPFKAHTLFCPQEHDADSPNNSGRLSRPDPSYAQASARYLKLITDGAEEHDLPQEYRDYLLNIRPYTITTTRQRMGQVIFMGIWAPLVITLFTLSRMLADSHGRVPAWLGKFQNLLFAAMWISYDNMFKKLFGDGERTIPRKKLDQEQIRWHNSEEKRALLSGQSLVSDW